jgi:hypothetical protein
MKAEARVLRSALMFERLRKQALDKPSEAKGFLGPSLRDNPDTPSIGRRVAVGRGLIVDELGKMRCPAGTPNANQFTDVQMSNCMIPSAETAANELVDAGRAIIEQVSSDMFVGDIAKRISVLPERDRQEFRDLSGRVSSIAQRVGLSKEDKGKALSIAANAGYWITYLGADKFGLNDIFTGMVDSDNAEGLALLSGVFISGGIAPVRRMFEAMQETWGESREQIDERVRKFNEKMDSLKVRSGEMSDKLKSSMDDIFSSIKSVFRGERRKAPKPPSDAGDTPKAKPVVAPSRLSTFTPSPDAPRITQKNNEVMSQISAAGGALNDLTPEFIESERNSISGSIGGFMLTHEQHTKQRKAATRDLIELLKMTASDREGRLSYEETQEFFQSSGEVRFTAQTSGVLVGTPEERREEAKKLAFLLFGGQINPSGTKVEDRGGYSPKVIALLRDADADEIEATVEKALRAFHGGLDPRVHVQIPSARIQSIFTDGRYKTTHEARSEHSGPDVRTNYEATLGIPRSAGPEVRPASGYVVHQDWEAARRKKREEIGKSYNTTDEWVDSVDAGMDQYGHVGIYGEVTVRLKPEVSGRTMYGWGDSFNNLIDPVPLSPDADIDDIGNAVLERRFKDGGRSPSAHGLLQILDGYLEGDFSRMRNTHGESNYAEALIMGSFSLEDIEEIELPWETVPWLPSAFFSRRAFETNDKESIQEFADGIDKVVDDIASEERLRELGATDEEISEIREIFGNLVGKIRGDNRFPSIPRDWNVGYGSTQKIWQYLAMVGMGELRTEAAAKGARVKTTSMNGADRWDITNYKEAEQQVGDVVQIWRNRATEAIIKDMREAIERRNRPPSTTTIDF